MPALTVNTTDYAIRAAREDLMGWAGALDAKRPRAWQQYGYPDVVTFTQLRTAYDRGGPGHGAVHRILDKCWQEHPRLKAPEQDAETPWESGVKRLFKTLGLWRKLRDFDRRNMVGAYAGLIYRVADGQPLSAPLLAGKLVDVIPLYEDQLRVTAWHSDTADAENFGKPKMWQYRRRANPGTDSQGRPDEWADVHPSRVQILAEGSVGDFTEGVPLLRAGFNHLVDLEKISGGSAESFLKNSARTVVLKFDAQASPQALTQNPDGTDSTKTVAEVVEEKITALNRSIDSSIVMQGGDASTLQTTVADPGPSFLVAANLFAAGVQIPFTILFGQQTGRLASDQDKSDMTQRCRSRQENELEPMLLEFVRRMQTIGAIDQGEFDVEWPALDAPGDTDKADLLVKMAGAVKTAAEAGITEPLFDANELRGVMGYEERADDGMPDPLADPALDPLADPMPAPTVPALPRRVA